MHFAENTKTLSSMKSLGYVDEIYYYSFVQANLYESTYINCVAVVPNAYGAMCLFG